MSTSPRAAFEKTRLMLNPAAAQDVELRQIVADLRERGFPIDVRVVWEHGDTERYIEEALGEGVDHVMVAGGDGTIHEALGVQQERGEGRSFALSALPFGTGNDFVRSIYTERALRVPTRELIEEIFDGELADVDVGEAQGQPFMNAVSIGGGAEVTESTPRPMKDVLGQRAYLIWGLLTLDVISPFPYELRCNGEVYQGEAWMIVVGNGQFVGGGFRACPEAELQDGLLDVMIMPQMGPLSTVKAVGMLLAQGNHPSHEQLQYLQTSELSLCASGDAVRVNVDGEPMEVETVQMRARSRASRWLVPRKKSSE